jgi:hypothetical protein
MNTNRRLLRTKSYSLGLSALLMLFFSVTGADEPNLIKLSQDPYTDPLAQHATEVEPVLAVGDDTIVSAFQVGRFQGVGSDNIGWTTSKDGGKSWQHGFLKGTSTFVGGPWSAVSLPTLAFDRKHHTFLIQMAAFDNTGDGVGILLSRSPDGLHWTDATAVGTGIAINSDWIACDNHVRSPFYGNCYGAWNNSPLNSVDDLIVSSDGGKTWGGVVASPDQTAGYVESIAIQPNGNFVLLGRSGGPNLDQEYAIQSIDGGHSLNPTVNITTSQFDYPYLRADPNPTSAVDAEGTIYAVFADCRFRTGCLTNLFPPNDLVMTTSKDGVTWSPVERIPIDAVTGTTDHVIPGLAARSGCEDDCDEEEGNAKDNESHTTLALTFYFIDNGVACVPANCDLNAGYISSDDSGKHWHQAHKIAGPMLQTWLASTYAGQMVADYISAVFIHDKPYGAFAIARPPNAKTGALDEAIYAVKLPE